MASNRLCPTVVESCSDILIFNNAVLHDVDMTAPRKSTNSTHKGVFATAALIWTLTLLTLEHTFDKYCWETESFCRLFSTCATVAHYGWAFIIILMWLVATAAAVHPKLLRLALFFIFLLLCCEFSRTWHHDGAKLHEKLIERHVNQIIIAQSIFSSFNQYFCIPSAPQRFIASSCSQLKSQTFPSEAVGDQKHS